MRALEWYSACGGVFCAVAVAPAPAAAQDDAGTPPAAKRPSLGASLEGAARESYLAATALFGNEDWAGAMAKYGDAYDASGDARLLYDMALCARGMHAYGQTWSLLTRFEREDANDLDAGTRAEVDAALTQLEDLVGKVDLDVGEAGASVAVDGRDAGVTPRPEPLVLDFGTHSISVTKSGFEPAARTIELDGPGRTRVVIELAPRVVATAAATGANVEASRGVVPPRPPDVRAASAGAWQAWKTPAGWALAGVGAGAIAVGSVFGVEFISDNRESRAQCPANRCSPGGYAKNQAARVAAYVADVGILAGVATTACGVYFLATPTPRGAAISLRGRW
ncbi:MAG: PEGA domain-containing protein [Polyangiaceae bacterium]|nr:PEGA domain-containing protein [Polyangiaceae bacterium]